MKTIVKILLVCFLISTTSVASSEVDSKSLPSNPNLIRVLNEIFDTNEKFSKSHDEEFFRAFKNKQTPNVTMVSCSDSRVHMLAIHENPKNEVFTIDNIGNQIATNEGSVDYGVEVLKTSFLIIMGHSDCGAVAASIAGVKTNLPAIDKELSTITLTKKDIKSAVVENVNMQVSKALEKYKSKVDKGELIVIGAIYDFKNDYGFGKGKVILTNINGVTDNKKLEVAYKNKIRYSRFLK